MNEIFTDQANRVIASAGRAAQRSGQKNTGTEHLLMGLLLVTDGTGSVVLYEAGATRQHLSALVDKLIGSGGPVTVSGTNEMSPRAARALETSFRFASRLGSEKAGTEHILLALLSDTECMATKLLLTMGVDVKKLFKDTLAVIGAEDAMEYEDVIGDGPENAGAAATPTLDKYSRDLIAMAREGKLDPVVGRESEMERVIQILSRRTKNNPCLIGEPGVGKTAIVEGLAQKIYEGDVPDSVKGKRLLVLDLSGMVAGSKYRGEFEERIKNVVSEIAGNKNVLLFIDELHTIIGAGGAEGSMDASNILKPSLSRGEIQVIGATTIDEYRKYIEKDAALERRFQPVTVEEPTEEEAVEILKGLRPYYEDHHKVRISDEALEEAVKLSERYINDRRLPDKAIDLIDEAASKLQIGSSRPVSGKAAEKQKEIDEIRRDKEAAILAGDMTQARDLQHEQDRLEKELKTLKKRQERRSESKRKTVEKEQIADVVSQWTKIPVSRLTEKESKRLAKLENELHKRVIGQDEAVKAVSDAIKRGRVGLKDPNRPIGSFLFLGPTGVGKTELSKAVAEAVFGSEQSMIRVDMSEYMEKYSVSKLIGSPPGYVGYEEGGQLSEQVRRNPYSVILFDEIEKAHPDVFNILLQVLDEGHITDAHGHRVDFKNTCIIMTSNAGAQSIIDPKVLGFSAGEDRERDYERMKSGVMDEVKKIFKPEFLNRIDAVIVFRPLTKEQAGKIAGLLVKQLVDRAKEQLDIKLKVLPSARSFIADKGFSNKFGARPIKRIIQDMIENELSEMILEEKVVRGDTVTVRPGKDGKLVFKIGG